LPPIKKLTCSAGRICLLIKQAQSAAFFEAFVKSFLSKKWEILIKTESESFVFTGLEIPRNHDNKREARRWYKLKKINVLDVLHVQVFVLISQ
jgi:hypothetical protein